MIADAESIRVLVVDDGAGISAELLPRVFDLFVQADRTLDRAQGGLGIGLSVVRKLVEMHGGEVSARARDWGRAPRSKADCRAVSCSQPSKRES